MTGKRFGDWCEKHVDSLLVFASMCIVGIALMVPVGLLAPSAYINSITPKVEVVCSHVTTNATTLVVINPTTTATVTKATTKAVNSTYYEIASEVHTCP